MPAGHQLISERLERRVLLSVSLSSTTGVLSVKGTIAGDQITFALGGNQLNVVEAGANYSFAATAVKAIQVSLGAGADSVSLGDPITIPATVTAGSGNDTLVGSSGPCVLVAGSGNDQLTGSGKQTTYRFLSQSSPVVYTLNQAASGSNVLDFSALPDDNELQANLTLNLLAVYSNVQVFDNNLAQLPNFNTIIDGQGPDVITASKTGTTVFGGNGYDDFFYGSGGADLFHLGNGYSVVSCQGSRDSVYGGGGHDVIFATDNNSDPLWFPGVLNDASPAVAPPGIFVQAGAGLTSIVGGAGDDTLLGGSGTFIAHGLGGGDFIAGGSGPAYIFADSGHDTIKGGTGDNFISGGTGLDLIFGGTKAGTSTFIDKGLADDYANASQGAVIDTVDLTAEAIADDHVLVLTTPQNPGDGDQVIGGAANTTIIGGPANDTLQGGNGPTTLVAGTGNQLLTGGNGDDVMQGGAGVDTLTAGTAPDDMTGGTGVTIFLNLNGQADTITGGSGYNAAEQDPACTPTYSNIQMLYNPYQQPNRNSRPALTQNSIGPVFSKTKIIPPGIGPANTSTPPLASVIGGVLKVGASTFTGSQFVEVTENPTGTLFTIIQAGVGTQTISAAGVKSLTITGGPGNDTLSAATVLVPTTIITGTGNDSAVGGAAPNTIIGGSGNDTLVGGSGSTRITAGSGNNLLYGEGAHDSLTGGSGVDWMFPSLYGSGTVVGGSGTQFLDLQGNNDPETIRMDLGTVTDNSTHFVTTVKNIRQVYTGGGSDQVVGSGAAGMLIVSGSGNDSLYGISSNDVIQGGPGNDQVFLDGHQGFLNLAGDHSTTPGNTDQYNQGTTNLVPSVDSTDFKVALKAAP